MDDARGIVAVWAVDLVAGVMEVVDMFLDKIFPSLFFAVWHEERPYMITDDLDNNVVGNAVEAAYSSLLPRKTWNCFNLCLAASKMTDFAWIGMMELASSETAKGNNNMLAAGGHAVSLALETCVRE
jgi:hypothetical protein